MSTELCRDVVDARGLQPQPICRRRPRDHKQSRKKDLCITRNPSRNGLDIGLDIGVDIASNGWIALCSYYSGECCVICAVDHHVTV